jgi:Holliday junction resolvase RusA-like endonuclease
MRQLKFSIKGSPKAQKRHRHTKKGFTYDPSVNDKRDFLALIHAEAPKKPLYGAISLTVRFSMPYPKKWLRTGKLAGELKPNAPKEFTNRPDIDNLLKFVLDSFNKVVIHDDSQVWDVRMQKTYSLTPGTEIIVEETDVQ